VGIIAHKGIVDHIKAKRLCFKPLEVVWGSIGGVVGSNAFQYCDMLYVVGQNHRDPAYGADIMMAIEDHLKCEKPVPGARYAKLEGLERKLTAQDFAWSELARDLIQMIGRGSNRRVIDRAGNCTPSVVKITLDMNNDLAQYLEREIQAHFHNVNLVPNGWRFSTEEVNVNFEDAQNKAEKLRKKAWGLAGKNKYVAIIQYFKLSQRSQMSVHKVCKMLGLSQDQAKWYAKKLSGQTNKKYRLMMETLGIGLAKLQNGKNKETWHLLTL
jgi:hypothetical protein